MNDQLQLLSRSESQSQLQPARVAGAPDGTPTSFWLRYRWLALALILLILIAAFGFDWAWKHPSTRSTAALAPSASPQPIAAAASPAARVPGLQLDPHKNYGDKYASGVLPVGDGKYSTATASTGNVYVCQGYARNLQQEQGGAGRRGPWFIGATQYDLGKKISVQGSVMWQADFSTHLANNLRTIVTNDLPSHPSGIFPIQASDPAYAYDRNPNAIKGQAYTYDLPASPSYGQPSCMGGQVGVMLTGVSLFNGFDAAGRDAGAWEVQDGCDGHPEREGQYHYHTLSTCIKDIGVGSVIGFALDGFPITGPKVGDKNFLTTSDLDECHGIVSRITLDGKPVTMYHYVMTQDFPYSVSCFRGQAIQPPGLAKR